MEELVYVTSNYGKYCSVKRVFDNYNIPINYVNYDIEELEVTSVNEVSLDKARKAYSLIGKPCFVQDTGFYIYGYPGKKDYPGTLVKRSGISDNVEELLDIMKNIDNRRCSFITCLTYYDGVTYKQFESYSTGYLSYKKRGELPKESWSRLWEVFIPEGYSKTLAEMTSEERTKRNSTRVSAIDEFAEWYKDKGKVKKKFLFCQQ